MYPAQFDYVRASSAAEAARLLAELPNAKLLAGGHSLIPILKLRLAMPATLIDIGRVAELKGVSVSGGVLRIGALTTHAQIAASAEVREHAPGLAQAAGLIGDPAVRNRGTVGGNIAHADPASDLPTVLLALSATVKMAGPRGERSVAAGQFFQGLMATALAEDELLTAVEIPLSAAARNSAYAKFPHPASRYAVVGAAAALTLDGGVCANVSAAIGGLTPAAIRLPSAEAALSGQAPTDEAIRAAAARTADDLGDDLLGDLFASAEYRKAVAHVYVRQALAAAVERAR